MSSRHTKPEQRLEIPPAYAPLVPEARYKITYGGRGSAKSWTIAQLLVAKAYTQTCRILCVREFQSSIGDSVHRLLSDRIRALGLTPWFDIQATSIRCLLTGSEFMFKGLRRNINEVRSTEGVTDCWVEEAHAVSEDSWLILIPTIFRTAGSTLWVSFNPDLDSDPTYKRFVLRPPPDAVVLKTSWRDNPRFPVGLELERRHMQASDQDAYEWVWEGSTRHISEAIIFRGKVAVETFEPPEVVDRYFFGADWGFANDPTTLIRSYIVDDTLFIDQEAYGVGVEIDATPALFDKVPGSRDWPIKADGARPETISYISRRGFGISAADKWPGSVEDGIAHLKAFKRIVVHERCQHTAQEFRLYSYKQDARTGDVLPAILDRHNHMIDALRYSLDGYIQARGSAGIFARLAG